MADHNNEKAAPVVADSVNATGALPPSTAPGAPGVPAGEHEPTTATGAVVNEKAPVVAEKKANRFDAADVRWSCVPAVAPALSYQLMLTQWASLRLFISHPTECTQRRCWRSACPRRHVDH